MSSPVKLNQYQQDKLTVKRGFPHICEVAEALMRIKDTRSYKEEYDTWEEFCQKELGYSAHRALQLTNAAEIVSELANSQEEGVQICTPSSLQNESQARALAKVEPKERRQVLEKATAAAAAEDRPMTSRDIKEYAEPPPAEKPAQKGLNLRRDKTGYVIPPPLQALWDRSDGIHRDLTRSLREIKESLADAYERKDKVLSTMMPHRQGLLLAFDDLIERLRELDPYAVCFYCQGQNTRDCMACKGRGFISKFAMTMVPKELIEVRARANKAA